MYTHVLHIMFPSITLPIIDQFTEMLLDGKSNDLIVSILELLRELFTLAIIHRTSGDETSPRVHLPLDVVSRNGNIDRIS